MSVSDQKLMIQGLGASLVDSMSLVARGALEMVLKYLPIDNSYIGHEDMLSLTQQILLVFLKRDVSLSRRSISWILANSPKSATMSVVNSEQIISSKSLELVATSLKNLFGTTEAPADFSSVSSAFRIMVSLLDKPEIGIPLSKSIMLDIIIQVYYYYYNVLTPKSDKAQSVTKMISFLILIIFFLVFGSGKSFL